MRKQRSVWHYARLLIGGFLTLLSVQAWAQPNVGQYPEKPIRFVVPYAAGSSPDVICRLIGNELSRQLGKAVVIDNKAGASAIIGTEAGARAAPDGYTMVYANVGTLAINQSLFTKLSYDPQKDLLPVGLLGSVQNALIVRNELPVKSVRELIDYAKKFPGKLTMGSSGNGTTGHLGGELFKSMTGTYMVHVPYRGSPAAYNDMLGGQVDVMFDNLITALPQIRAGKVRLLGVSGAKRSPFLPDAPTIDEAGVKGYETLAWGGISVPAGTPREIIQRLNAEINRALASPSVKAGYESLAFEVSPGTPEQFGALARREAPKWASVIQRAGARVD
jgi:tripartite-type tricarboxylate transporter receptor subunit TctC